MEFAAAAAKSPLDGANKLVAYAFELQDRSGAALPTAYELALKNVGDAVVGAAFHPSTGAGARFPQYSAAIAHANLMLDIG